MIQLSNEQARRLLEEIQQESEFWKDFHPMTDEEVVEIEAAYEPVELSPDAQSLSEQKRQEFMDMIKEYFSGES